MSSILKRINPLLAATILAVAGAANAQTAPMLGQVQFAGVPSGNPSIGGFQVGPYSANLSSFASPASLLNGNNAIIWCVDFKNSSNSSFDSYYATAFASNTGTFKGDGDFSKTYAGLADTYKKYAYLIEQYEKGAAGFTNQVDIQATIWKISNGGTLPSGFGSFTDLSSYVTTPSSLTLTKNWYVLSDDCKTGVTCATNDTQSQEYLTSRTRSVVPEPSTYALMGVGLLSVGFMSRRRRNSAALVA